LLSVSRTGSQDFDTKNYTIEFYGRSITIAQQEFADGTWQEIVRSALQANVRAHSLAEGGGEFGFQDAAGCCARLVGTLMFLQALQHCITAVGGDSHSFV